MPPEPVKPLRCSRGGRFICSGAFGGSGRFFVSHRCKIVRAREMPMIIAMPSQAILVLGSTFNSVLDSLVGNFK